MHIVYICDCCEEVIAERAESEFDTVGETLTSCKDVDIINHVLDSNRVIIKCVCDDCRQGLSLCGDFNDVVTKERN